MQYGISNNISYFFYALVICCTVSCSTNTDTQTAPNQMQQEVATLDSLLRNADFAMSVSRSLDSAYYAGIGQVPPDFITPQEDTSAAFMRVKDEKVATSVAGFYALECGIGLLCAQSGQLPVEWLNKIVKGTAGSGAVLLLNRFANATWKAGQPFRGLSRITRDNFRVAGLLSEDEIKKDSIQIRNAASRLLSSMDTTGNNTLALQMQNIRALLQDTAYAVVMSGFLDSSYAISQHQQPAPFLSPVDATAATKKSAKEMKIATSIAGFYALECGVDYLATTRQQLPSVTLQSLLSNALSNEDRMIFARFANATWKAGQPFRGLNRVTRTTFTPFYFLTEPDIDKDLVQVKAAAQRVYPFL